MIAYDSPVELIFPGYVQPSARSKWPAGTVYRSAFLPADAIAHQAGYRITKEARTVIDAARWHSFAEALAVADGFLGDDPLCRHLLWQEAHAIGKAKGAVAVRRALTHATTGIGSAAESWARAQLIDAKFPKKSLKTQHKIVIGGQNAFVDFLIDGWLVVEVDGRKKYGGQYGPELQVTERELMREKKIKNLGYEVFRADWNMLKNDEFIPQLLEFRDRPSRRHKPGK